jgi:hypothetical protein
MTDLLIMALWTAVMAAGIIIPIIAMIICFQWVFKGLKKRIDVYKVNH